MSEPTKEATYLLLDVAESMRPHLADAKAALKAQLTNKVLFSKQDVVGLALLGTEDTENAVNEEMGDGQYENISVKYTVAKATFKAVSALDEAECEGETADLIDGLVVGMDAVCKFVRQLKFRKRVVLVTDGSSYAETELDDIADNLLKESIKLTVIGVGLTDVKSEVKPEDGGATPREKFVQALGVLRTRLGGAFELLELSDVLKQGSGLAGKSVRPSKAFQGALQIGGGLSIPVHCWRRVSKAANVTFKNVCKQALGDDLDGPVDQPDATVTSSRTYRADDADDEVPPELRQNAYKYGKDIVPVTTQDEEAMKFGVLEKCMQLVGMVPQEDVPPHLLMTKAQCLVGDPGAPYAHSAVSALGMAMEEEGLVAIVRYAERKGGCPRLFCLKPGARCLFLHAIPFEEELRRMEWQLPPKEAAAGPSAEQQAAADALVDALDFCNPAVAPVEPEPGRGKHAVRPKDVGNPTLQRTYQIILHKALSPSDGLPAPDWRVMAPLKPDPALFSHAKPALDAFCAACPTAKDEKDEKKPQKRAGAANGGSGAAGEGVTPTPPAKQQKTGGEAAAATGATLALTKSRVDTIDTGKPIEAFWAILGDKQEDRLGEAFTQFEKVIRQLLDQAATHTDADADKAFRCLREFRRAAVQEEEPGYFNKCLRDLKTHFMSRGKTEFWSAIIHDESLQPGLITAAETEESDVSAEQAASFFAADVGGPTQAMDVEEAPQAAEDEYDGLD